ncbi:MAG: 2-C-methyl-D-erythritol 4-phosphate cytidylyltransferase, partial [Candidatus Eremiobacteraeota bacterium]|nr:2-C-methyl-D-erythritol 4-phosphate cytidylyltransferase [Candidatus Eremiobacteraeota bacterium]
MRWGAIIVAAGSGSRFGRPKQLVELAGAPMLSWSLRTLASMPEITDVVIVTEPDCVEPIASMASQAAPGKAILVVPGGATRQGSSRAGIEALHERVDAVLIHDGARPLVHASDVRRGMSAIADGRAALLALPVVDTIKVVDAGKGTVLRTLDRDQLWAAQTPQFATLRDMRRAHLDAARSGADSTDDATLLERA